MAVNNDLRTKEEIKLWILRKLGSPVVRVELTSEQLDDAIEDARRWFSAKKGEKRGVLLPTVAGVSEYDLPEDAEVIFEVVPTANRLDFALLLNPFTFLDEQQIPYQIYAAPMSGGLYSTLVQALQSVETAKRVIGAEFEWRQDGNKLTILPVPKSAGNVLLQYKSVKFTIEQLNERDHDLVKRYSLASAKATLGRVRSKYPAWPTAQGSTSMDGNTLLTESEKELERLDDEISNSGFPLGFLCG